MKVYLFYQVMDGLEPVLYGYTHDKLRASIFRLYRPRLHQVVKEVKKSEYADMMDKMPGRQIIPYEFRTSDNHFGNQKVSQIATETEITSILLYKDELVMNELSKHSFPLELFSQDVQKSLRFLHMDTVNKWQEEVIVIPGDTKTMEHMNFEVDELGLFVQLYGHTMEDRKRRQ